MAMKGIKNRLRHRPLLVTLWRSFRALGSRVRERLFKEHPGRLYDLDLRQGGSQPLTKRALLSYIVHPFSIPRHDPRFLRHINIWHAQEIVRILNQLAYIVDVVDYRDTSFVPRKRYDLFVGHGGINFERIAQRLPDGATKIYFSTGCYWKFHNGQELSRFAALRERRRVDLPPDRLIKNSEEGALLAADGVIGFGNGFTRQTYAAFSPVIMLNSTSLFDDMDERHDKDFDEGKANFLYFAGAGPVHKGLDLLLETFVGLDQHLWICSGIDQRFAQVYSDELHNRSNVHLVGWVQPRSARFCELMDSCNWVILPSCSEGQAHSVVECMNQGLIPVVSRACGLDVEDYGVVLDPCTIEEISTVVSMLSSYSAAQCREMSVRARKAAASDFSESKFANNMTKAIQYMIAQRASQELASPKPRPSQALTTHPWSVDEDGNVLTGREAAMQLQAKNDMRYLQREQGIVEIDMDRWKEAQRYERRAWMEGAGLNAREDRNTEHEEHFENYAAIQGRYFGNAIEIGCGPFTNMIRILEHVRCGKVTLLDPLVEHYLSHPHCTYKRKRLGGWFGNRVQTVGEPIESFSSHEVYDLVVVINVLEHCFSVAQFCERLISLTAPNGILVFHDKLIPASVLKSFVRNIYDAGHPLRVADSLILEFLSANYGQIFRKYVPIPSAVGAFDSVYFIGQKRM